MKPDEARPGVVVRVKEDKRRPELDGMFGIIQQRYGDSEYAAVEVHLATGQEELFWLYQVEKAWREHSPGT